jgi:AcrR family transcriptional regulator
MATDASAAPPQAGLRERKKRRTRQLISETARGLFAERGFDRVTVAEIARSAEVSLQTVFNYFPTKEGLFFSGLEDFEAELLDAIRERDPGESILAAFFGFVTEASGLLAAGDPEAIGRLRAIARLIDESPALLAHEQQIYAAYTSELADLIAAETNAQPGAIAPTVAANAMIGLHKSLVDYVRRSVLAGERDRARIVRRLRAQAREGLALLERGLSDLG